jgi:hypothetical protein
MMHAVQITSYDMIHIPSLKTTGSGFQTLLGEGCIYEYIDTEIA